MTHTLEDRCGDTDRFYDLLDELGEGLGGPRRLAECAAASGWPQYGVYFFFEEGQTRAGNSRPRCVRVGTHALTATSRTTLWTRLAQHRGQVSGRNPGGGNHRGSIFRHHVGCALMATGDWSAGVERSWLLPKADSGQKEAERPLERVVTARIGAMPLLWLDVPDRSKRRTIESNAIALLSERAGGIDRASSGWLGLHAINPKMRTSGLWNSNHVDDSYQPSFLDDMDACRKAML